MKFITWNNYVFCQKGRVRGVLKKKAQYRRDAFLIKFNHENGEYPSIKLGSIYFPKSYAGKRVKIKIEVLE